MPTGLQLHALVSVTRYWQAASRKIAPERLRLSLLASRLDKQPRLLVWFPGRRSPIDLTRCSIISRQPAPGDAWHHGRGPGPDALIVHLHQSSRWGDLTRVPADHHGDL